MVFSSMIFIWIFLPLIFAGNVILQKIGGNQVANIFLLIASLLFYAWGEPICIILLLLSIIINWAGGIIICSLIKSRRSFFVFIVLLNLVLLGYFKYAGMMIRTLNQIWNLSFEAPPITLPIGISFFTFQALSYIVDVYRKECPAQKNIFKVALYLSFFPQLIAGPIVKYKDMEQQIDQRKISVEQIASGIRRFVYGFAKKVLISNALASSVDTIYALPIENVSSILAWGGALMYTFQIYYDFSGYSDMAIGLGKMFGFEFRENFEYPYISLSIREFWRRWHISLSEWFRDYVYIPLGGSYVGKIRTYRNLLIVFFLTGLWHGASWNYVLWGMLHGAFIIMERIGFDKLLRKNRFFSWIYTFSVVNLGWVFFHIEDVKNAVEYVKRMILPWRYIKSNIKIAEFVNGHTMFMLACGVIGMGIIQRLCPKSFKSKWMYSYAEIFAGILLLIYSIANLASNTYNPFIYYRF